MFSVEVCGKVGFNVEYWVRFLLLPLDITLAFSTCFFVLIANELFAPFFPPIKGAAVRTSLTYGGKEPGVPSDFCLDFHVIPVSSFGDQSHLCVAGPQAPAAGVGVGLL